MPRTALVAFARHSLRHHPRRPTPTLLLHRHSLAPRRPFSMSGITQYSSSKDVETDKSAAGSQKQQQGLPAPGEGTPVTLDVSGEGSTVRLAELGPLVVNVDGTVARITNWKEMTGAERETTVRMVGRRNKQRLDALKKQNEEQEGGAQ
ncbi:hypothetical protein LEL_05248 [Akanthomyces lecanii RCEF 1005]|uniref:Fungal specific transcription factor n=1 Tax=Akanthomyces lecanii RCEF 1005 TaxID=1081108 RepID=A0A162IUS8_CORDF|nr:hypothetical protein LEL_05248 [Akanthomyces lecanii RCEF 1005]